MDTQINLDLDKEYIRIFAKYGTFFAFNRAQFDERSENDKKYCRMGCGLFCPTESVDALLDEFNHVEKKAMIEKVEKCGAEAIIRHEYFNHESHIAMDGGEAAKEALRPYQEVSDDFSDERIDQIFADCFKEAVTKDLF